MRCPLRILACLGLLALAGCGGHGADDVIRLGIANAPRNLDPRLATDATSERVNRLLYAALVAFDEASLPRPSLASWRQESATEYLFTLAAERQAFSDGSRLVCADVQATYASILDPDIASPHRAALSQIEAVECVDDERIRFRISEPNALFPAYLGIGILPARLIEAGHRFQDAPLGSGPLVLESWPDPGRLSLRRLRDGQRLELVQVKDPSVRVMKLLRGEVDLLQNDLPPELIGLLERSDGVRVERVAGSNFSYLGLNLDDPATARPEVRRAIAHAIDREQILRYLFGGGRLAEALLPPGHWAGAKGIEPIAHDPARARALLREAGYGPDKPLKLTIKTSSDPFRVRLATVLQTQLADAGIAAQVQSYDWGTFFGDVKAGRFQLYGLTWVGIQIPDIFRYAFHSASIPPDGANRGRYRSAAADRLIERARAEQDLESQALLYGELQQLLHRDLPYVPLWYEDQVVAAGARVSGYRLAADGNYDGLATVRLAASAAASDGVQSQQ